MEPFRTEDIHFTYGSAELNPYAQQSLNNDLLPVTAILRDYPQAVLSICGYADKAELAPEASRQRATAVRNYLEQKGTLERLRAATFGYRPREVPYPSAPELNRRVELGFSACTGQVQN
jgi:outer membrane protein OmpA-like peptidoglycan-associated protein